MTLAEFRAQYPEFTEECSDEFLGVFLDAAAGYLSAAYWGSYYDQAHGLKTAHLVVIAPNGKFARLQTDKGTSIYEVSFNKLREEVTFADRVF